MISVLSWLVGSKAGRITAVVAISLAMVGLALLRAFQKGEAAERAKQATATLDNIRKKVAIDEKVRSMPPADRRAELARWVRG